eukprot:5892132-Lingulodinium_polyedra.AAC.1
MGITVLLGYVRTRRNPADDGTRKRALRTARARPASLDVFIRARAGEAPRARAVTLAQRQEGVVTPL